MKRRNQRKRPVWVRSALTLVLLCALGYSPLAVSSADERFRSTAELTPIAQSADQRYSLQAQASRVQTMSSTDARFVLHQLNVPEGGCDPLQDALFDDGFE